MQKLLQSTGVWQSVVDGYTPPKQVKSTTQKEEKGNDTLVVEIIQKNLSNAMRNKMRTITSAKEMWLSLEHVFKENDKESNAKLITMLMEDKTDDEKRLLRKFKTFENFEEQMFKTQWLESEKLGSIGKYIGNISKPPVDFIENDCSKVEKCFIVIIIIKVTSQTI